MRYPFELWDTDCARHGLIAKGWKWSLDVAARIQGKTGYDIRRPSTKRKAEREGEKAASKVHIFYMFCLSNSSTFVRLRMGRRVLPCFGLSTLKQDNIMFSLTRHISYHHYFVSVLRSHSMAYYEISVHTI